MKRGLEASHDVRWSDDEAVMLPLLCETGWQTVLVIEPALGRHLWYDKLLLFIHFFLPPCHQKIDVNQDGLITFEELSQWCTREERFVKSLGMLDTVL